MTKALTPKQERFALLLFQGVKQHDAYLQAGYSANQLSATIDRHACELADDDNVVARVAQLQAKAESDAIGTVQERQKRLTEIYRANLTDFVDKKGNIVLKPSAAVAELTIEDWKDWNKDGTTSREKRIKLRDPIEAIKEHNRMERIGTSDMLSQTNNDNRTYNIVVAGGSEAKERLDLLLSGAKPQDK